MADLVDRTISYKIEPRKAAIQTDGAKGRPHGSCVLLHGWDSTGNDMLPLSKALQGLPHGSDWAFYTSTYETHTETFVQAAGDLYAAISSLVQPIILIGYSEGALVARQLIADGLQATALVTICGPHLGLGTWIPTPDAGSSSLSPFSDDIKRLNQSPIDQRHRATYHFFAITCRDFWGIHADDGVVPVSSALGSTLGPVAERVTIDLDYGTRIAGVDPHLRGMDPTILRPVLDTCGRLLV